MASRPPPTAGSIWRHLPMPPIQSAVTPPPFISDHSKVNAVRTHMTTLNASVEALSSTLTAATSELGEAKREVRALVDLQTEALQNVTGEMTHLVNRAQTAIIDSLGSQSIDVSALAPLIRINYAKIDALDARLTAGESTMRAVQTRFDALERQIADFSCASRMLFDQQAQSISHLTTLLQLSLSRTPSSPPSLSPTSGRKRARSITDSSAYSSRLAQRRAISSPIGYAGLGLDDVPASYDAAGPLTSSSFIPREAMPGGFGPQRALNMRPPSPPPSSAIISDSVCDVASTNPPVYTSRVPAEVVSPSSRSAVSQIIPDVPDSDRPEKQLAASPPTSTTMATGSAHPASLTPPRSEIQVGQQDMDHEDFLDYRRCFALDPAQMMTVCPMQYLTQIRTKRKLDPTCSPQLHHQPALTC